MTGPVVDMAPFWWEIAAPAALAVLLAAGYVLAAWRRPALRTPIASFRAWRALRGRVVQTGDLGTWSAGQNIAGPMPGTEAGGAHDRRPRP